MEKSLMEGGRDSAVDAAGGAVTAIQLQIQLEGNVCIAVCEWVCVVPGWRHKVQVLYVVLHVQLLPSKWRQRACRGALRAISGV